MLRKHIMVEAALDSKNPNRWYDNPDLSDLLFSIFSIEKEPSTPTGFAHNSICLKTYKAGVGGFNNFQLDKEGNFKASFISAADKPLQDKIAYYPILTSGRDITLQDMKILIDGVLDGIDNGQDGMPKLILIPVLMHHNHFGTIAIEPNADKTQIKVSYFNSLGSMRSYEDEEKVIGAYIQQRYEVEMKHNGEDIYQKDGDSCGPYSTEFSTKTARLALDGISPSTQFTKEGNYCGMEVLSANKDSTTRNRVLKLRQEQAAHLVSTEDVKSLKTNYTLPLFVQCNEQLQRIASGEIPENKDFKFEHIGSFPKHLDKSNGRHEMINGKEVRTIDGHDVFEMKPATVGWMKQHIALQGKPVEVCYKDFSTENVTFTVEEQKTQEEEVHKRADDPRPQAVRPENNNKEIMTALAIVAGIIVVAGTSYALWECGVITMAYNAIAGNTAVVSVSTSVANSIPTVGAAVLAL